MKIGKDSVVIGNVPSNLEVGEGCVIIGATDNRGNTVINQPMAVGRNAQAGANSIAIGPGAMAGGNVFHLIRQLKEIPEVQVDKTLLATISLLETELQKDIPQPSAIQPLWSVIQTSATVSGAVSLVQQIGRMLGVV